ncbi:MAG: UPF0149 family protein [Rhodomicrobium sp.]|jgi:uncharacterized protein
MTLEEITWALKSADTPSEDALRAGLAEADRLAPIIFDLAGKLCEGVFLLPGESALLRCGLTILAASKHPGLYPYLLKLTRLPQSELEPVFPLHISNSLTRLLLSVWDGDADALFAAIENGELNSEVRWSWFDVLSRLAFDGVISRERALAFLARLEREGAIEDGDIVWWGWEEAVIRLGATELEPALRRVWAKGAFDQHTPEEHEESLALLHRAASNLADPASFDNAEICAIGDPAEALAWIGRREKAMETWRAEKDRSDDDPARSISLTGHEIDWLSGFLESRQAPETAMPFETLDGFFTALVIGPELVMPSGYLPEIWGTEDGSGPVWDSMEQLQYFMDLLTKHWNAIAARRNADAPHLPQIDHFGGLLGQGWAQGFVAGMNLCADAWDALMENEEEGDIALQVLALAMDDSTLLPDDTRAAIAEELPDIVRTIAAYWRNPPALPARKLPFRSSKIGRNEPCPCGSGKKYKKCCGASSPPTVH